tara:strand:- start:4049 stop:5239 length:1191 start_codon:yes stop_codon:yes gene_type:complete
MSKLKKSNYLVGKNSKLNISIQPFNSKVLDFLDDLSKTLNYQNRKSLSDIKALSFFCRKNNILNLKKKHYDPNSVRFGLGLLFHITPSNIPTNFAYSLIFGLITGNSNIVKVPSREFEEIEIICNSINSTLKKKEFSKIKNMIAIIRYTDNDSLTKQFSDLCDARLIWGGNKTISNIKKFETKAKSIDLPFADRYSISVINSESFLKLKKNETQNLIRNFYNDTYVVDQNACSSPHLVLWKGKYDLEAKKKFWDNLDSLVKNRYDPPIISSIDNFSRLVGDLMKDKNITSFKKYNKSLYIVSLKKLSSNYFIRKSKWGFFYQCNIKNLEDIKKVTNRSLQTLSYFGFSKKLIRSFFTKNNLNGIDRVVPFGQALNINLIWDGFDLTKILSREIEIK